jgi:hypothetical protein
MQQGMLLPRLQQVLQHAAMDHQLLPTLHSARAAWPHAEQLCRGCRVIRQHV